MRKSAASRLVWLWPLAAVVLAALALRTAPPDRAILRRAPAPAPVAAIPAPVEAEDVDLPTAAPALPPVMGLGSPVQIREAAAGRIVAGNADVEQAFTADRVALSTPGGRLSLALKDITLGARALPHETRTEPRLRTGDSPEVVYDRGGVQEKYVLLPNGLEQVFVLDKSHQARRGDGDLRLSVELETALTPVLRSTPDGDVVDLQDGAGKAALRYGAAWALDAAGRTSPLAYALRDRDLVMTLPAGWLAEAAFPVLIDPGILSLSTNAIVVTVGEGATAPITRTITVTNAAVGGGGVMKWNTSVMTAAGGAWLSISPGKGALRPGRSKRPIVTILPSGLTAAGSPYAGTITFGGNATSGSPQIVNVTINVVTTPIISLDPPAVAFDSPVGGPAAPDVAPVTLTNAGGDMLTWAAAVGTSSGGAWLKVDTTTGPDLGPGASTTLNLTTDPTVVNGLAAGSYSGTLTVTGTDSLANPVTQDVVTVTLTVNQLAKISLSATSLTFTDPEGGPAVDSPQTVTLSNTGSADLVWTSAAATTAGGSWLSVLPASGTIAPGQSVDLQVQVNLAGLVANTYDGTLTISDPAAVNDGVLAETQIAVLLDVIDTPSLQVSTPDGTMFSRPSGSTLAPPKSLVLLNDGFGSLPWTAATTTFSGGSWLSISAAAGTLLTGESTTLDIQVDATGLAAGTYQGRITIDSSDLNAVNVPQDVFITLVIYTPPTLELSTTQLTFDVPLDGTTSPQTVTVTNAGTGSLVWTATVSAGAGWLSVSPAAGSLASAASRDVDVAIDATGLAEGSYVASVTFDGTQGPGGPTALGSPRFVVVRLNVNKDPKIGLSATSLTFDAPLGGPATTSPQTVVLTNTGSLPMTYAVSDNASWLTVTPAGPAGLLGGQSVNLSAALGDISSLTAQVYTATITVSGNATNAPRLISVTLTIHANPYLLATPDAMTFDMPLGGPNPAAGQIATITNAGGATLTGLAASASDSWITLTGPGTSLTPGSTDTVTVGIDGTALAAGTYVGTVTLSGDAGTDNSPRTITVTLNVNNAPSIGLSATTLSFTKPYGGADPAGQTLTITNVGTGLLDWTGTILPAPPAWLTVTPLAATPPGLSSSASEDLSVTVDPTGLAPGLYTATLRIADAAAGNSPRTVFITLAVAGPPLSLALPSIPSAGFCGLLGVEVFLPFGLLALWRRARRARRGIAGAALLLAAALAVPAARAEDEAPAKPAAPQEQPPVRLDPTVQAESPASDFADFSRLESTLSASVLLFSSEFEADPQFGVTLHERLPLPWLSHDVLGFDGAPIGLFAQVTISKIERDLDGLEEDSATLFLAGGGVDFEFYGSEDLFLRAQAGIIYGSFGDVDEVDDGVAGLLGLEAGIRLSETFALTAAPQALVADGDQIYLVSLGLTIDF